MSNTVIKPIATKTDEVKGTFFPALTGVRAIAAYLVFISHYNFLQENSFGTTLYRMGRELHIGVTIFFVLSGFLIYYRYSGVAKITRPWLKTYLVNRVARIYPVYFLLLLVTFLLVGFPEPFVVGLNFTLTKAFFEQYIFTTGIGPAWTLTLEECFYLVAPLLFLLAKKRGGLWLAYVVIESVALFLIFVPFPANPYYGNFAFVMVYTFFGRAFEFFVGMFLAKLLLEGKFKRPAALKRLPFTYLGLVSIGLVVFLMSQVATPEKIAFWYRPGIILNNFVLPLVIAVWFYGLLTEETLLKRLLASKLFVLLGASSYVFYLIHYDAFYLALPGRWLGTDVTPGAVLVRFVIINLLAIALYKLVEQPLNRLVKHILH